MQRLDLAHRAKCYIPEKCYDSLWRLREMPRQNSVNESMGGPRVTRHGIVPALDPAHKVPSRSLIVKMRKEARTANQAHPILPV